MPRATRLTTTLDSIPDLARNIAAQLRGGEILALVGDLGSGKTTFTKHLARLLKVKQQVSSPTFVVMNLFPGRLKSGRGITLYHLDLYRTASFREVGALGITEFWGKPGTVTVIEWADKIKRHLPPGTIVITFRQP